MRPDNLILTSSGFYSKNWSPETRDYVLEKYDFYNTYDLLEAWSVDLQIEEMVSLHHLLSVWRQFPIEVRDAIDALTNSYTREFLAESTKIFPASLDESELYCIEVFRRIDISNWSNVTQQEFDTSIGCHGLGKSWDGPDMQDVELEERGNSYAIEFTPWYRLRDLPLTLRKKAFVCITTWAKSTKDRVLSRDQDGNPLDYLDKEIVGTKHEEWDTNFTLGEFFQGLLDELAFFGSPEIREKHRGKLKEALEDIQDETDTDKN